MKDRFLKDLDKELKMLNQIERNEIIDMYKERIETAIAKGQDAKQVISSIETPKQIAANVYAEYKIESKQVVTSVQTKNPMWLKIVAVVSLDSMLLIPLVGGLIGGLAGLLSIAPSSLFWMWQTIYAFIYFGAFDGVLSLVMAIGIMPLGLFAIWFAYKTSVWLIKRSVLLNMQILGTSKEKRVKWNIKPYASKSKSFAKKIKITGFASIAGTLITCAVFATLLGTNSFMGRQFRGEYLNNEVVEIQNEVVTEILVDYIDAVVTETDDTNISYTYFWDAKNVLAAYNKDGKLTFSHNFSNFQELIFSSMILRDKLEIKIPRSMDVNVTIKNHKTEK